MADDIQEIVRAQVAEHLRAERQLQLQKARLALDARENQGMLLVSPFGKLPQEQEKAARPIGESLMLAPAALPAISAEPNLLPSGLATLAGLAVLFLAMRRLWR